MTKAAEAFRTISEVAEALGTPAHVLRFWESKFSQIKPVKRAGGRRYYRPSDVALLAGIKVLLHDRGITIRGVQKILREDGVRQVALLADAGTPAQAAADRVIAKAAARPRRNSAAKVAPAPAAPAPAPAIATPAAGEAFAAPAPPAPQAAPRPAGEAAVTRLREVETLLFDDLPKAPAPAAPAPPPAAAAPGPGALLWSDRLRRAHPRADASATAAAALLLGRAQALRDRIAARAQT